VLLNDLAVGGLHQPPQGVEHQFLTVIANVVVEIHAGVKGLHHLVEGAQLGIGQVATVGVADGGE
jgi:hypothetical protein